MICKDDFLIGCAVSLKQCLGMINGETDGSEATRAVVEAAKAVAGGNFQTTVKTCYYPGTGVEAGR